MDLHPDRGSSSLVLERATTDIASFRSRVPEAALDDLRRRLALVRWPDAETLPGWAQGVPLVRARRLVDYWLRDYDWRRGERVLNAFPQYRTSIDGLGIHFLHVRSRHADALPIIITHGWPGSVFELVKLVRPLVDPTSFDGRPSQAFHVVMPSLPGFGFSDIPSTSGWGVERTAGAWQELMRRLGYRRYVAAGGDFGSAVTHALAALRSPALVGMHTSFPTCLFDPPAIAPYTPEEADALAQLAAYRASDSAHAFQMTTRPQTVGYGLEDSPVGLGTWIYEKLAAWTDSPHDPDAVLGRNSVLDNITLYWLTGTATSSARFFWEDPTWPVPRLQLPVGVTAFPADIVTTPKVWAERTYPQLTHFSRAPEGGHFPAWEVPLVLAQELRATFEPLR
ncbi:epoxide hydrolase family protein [Pedococcus sp. KACC 23699]|uniref:Epoxide hydrolase family protein n=1 Tax=Pedococcus sp. KACC 23699 TaxID=3149228 RepID=A0AAU7JVF0_9MICO